MSTSDRVSQTFGAEAPERLLDGRTVKVTLLDGRVTERLVRPSVASRPGYHIPTAATDPFVARFAAMDKSIRLPKRGHIPALKGSYEAWRSFILDAVTEDALPSRELIWANYQLAAWEAHLSIGKVASFPVSFSAALTDICNARCNFCAYAPERVTEKTLSLESVRRSDWLKFSRLFRPNAQLGEPFAHPQAVEVFQAIRERAPFLDLASITNGSLLRQREIELVAGNFSLLYVSVNATSKATYEKVMPPLKWERLIDNFMGLKEAKARLKTVLPRLDAGYVLSTHNLDDLPALPELLHRLGFGRVNIKPMNPPPRCSTSNVLLTPDDSVFTVPERAAAIFKETEQEAARYGIELVRPLPSLEIMRRVDGRPTFTGVAGLSIQHGSAGVVS
jgi:MoaA/NifB/PqqE/SkfB family radical SAM enzyme